MKSITSLLACVLVTLYSPLVHGQTEFEKIKAKAEQGDAKSQYYLCRFYQRGIDSAPKSPKKAYEWMKKSAEQGYAEAQFHLSIMYRDSEKIPKDNDKKAFEWMKKSAELGFVPAQNELGSMYLTGLIVKKDLKQAAIWFKKVKESDYPGARAEAEYAWNFFKLWKYIK